MSSRYFYTYGTFDAGTVVDVRVNGKSTVKNLDSTAVPDPFGQYGQSIVEFDHDVSSQGFSKIQITVLQGRATVGRTRVRYTGLFDSQSIDVYIQQPIIDPRYGVFFNGQPFVKAPEDQELNGEWTYLLENGDTLSYFHMYLNGPNYWIVPNREPYSQQFQQFQTVWLDNLLDIDSKYLYTSIDNAKTGFVPIQQQIDQILLQEA